MKKLLAVILALLSALILSSCAKSSGDDAEPTPGAHEAAAASTDTADVETDVSSAAIEIETDSPPEAIGAVTDSSPAMIEGPLADSSSMPDGELAEAVAGKIYKWEKDGFHGDFTIQLFRDRTYIYYEGDASSYIGRGSWEVTEGVLVLTENTGNGFIFRFGVRDGELVFIAEGSSSFTYVRESDGDRFLPVGSLPEEPEPQE